MPGSRANEPVERSTQEPQSRLRVPTELPLYGNLELDLENGGGLSSLDQGDGDQTPPTTWTLDEAIARLLEANLELRAQSLELPQAEADIVTAGLWANPILLFDTQFIPYGSFSEERPGGPTQYDLSITMPLDLSGKRKNRVAVASATQYVLVQRYRDAVRVAIADLSLVFLDMLAAQAGIQLLEAGQAGLEEALNTTRRLFETGVRTQVDVARIEVQRELARLALNDARAVQCQAADELIGLLNLPGSPQVTPTIDAEFPIATAPSMMAQGSLRQIGLTVPDEAELIAIALRERPDLHAFRLGLTRALKRIDLARSEVYDDVFLIYQPYLFQDLSPFGGSRNATSWLIGVSVPLPIFNRNQGNIRRAELNVAQTQIELRDRERRVARDVRQASRENRLAESAVVQLEQRVLPRIQQVRRDTQTLLRAGEVDALIYLASVDEANRILRRYLDALVRHRRAQVQLNAAVGRRLLP